VIAPVDPDRDHVPDLKSVDSLMDVLALSFLGIMSNVLDFRTYRYPERAADEPLTDDENELMKAYDLNAMNRMERTLCMYVRAMGWKIQEWVKRHYALENADGEPGNLDSFIMGRGYNAHMICAILQYKLQADLQKVKGAPGCTYERLKSQIDRVVIPNSILGREVEMRLRSKDHTLNMDQDVRGLKLNLYSAPVKPKNSLSTKELIAMGESVADDDYRAGVEGNFKLPRSPDFGIGFTWDLRFVLMFFSLFRARGRPSYLHEEA